MCKLAATIWLSPLNNCDVCKASFGEPDNAVMYDAALPGIGGAWGNVCEPCFKTLGGALGIGRGQRYDLLPYGDGKAWIATAGLD